MGDVPPEDPEQPDVPPQGDPAGEDPAGDGAEGNGPGGRGSRGDYAEGDYAEGDYTEGGVPAGTDPGEDGSTPSDAGRDSMPGSVGVEQPTYAKPWFVAVTVLGCAVLAWVIYLLGSTGSTVDEAAEAVSVPEGDTPAVVDKLEPARREDCPDPGEPVEYEAAELLQLFAATATGGGFGDLPATGDVQALLEANDPSPVLNRLTRIGGWTGGPGSWSTCVLSYWLTSDGPMQSIDLVTAAVVAGSERSDIDPEEDDDDPEDLPDRWEITSWVRGVAVDPPATRVAAVEFYNSKRACRRPDRPASVPVEGEDPDDRLLHALEELASGTPGRANSATTRVPADLQVVDATVSDGRAVVVLTPTLADLSNCEGTAAFEQVRETAAGVAAETIPFGDGREPEVEVVIDGAAVDSLRR